MSKSFKKTRGAQHIALSQISLPFSISTDWLFLKWPVTCQKLKTFYFVLSNAYSH